MPDDSTPLAAFVSHASDDYETAIELVDHLEKKGLKCWIAPRDISPSRTYGKEISRGIDRAGCLLLLVSENSNNSQGVRNEVELAFRKNKPIFPIRLENVPPGAELEFFVSSVQWIEAWKGRLSEYVQYIAAAIETGQVPPQAFRRSKGSLIRSGLAAAGALAALVVAIMIYWEVSALRRGTNVADDSRTNRNDIVFENIEKNDFRPTLTNFARIGPEARWQISVRISPRIQQSRIEEAITGLSYSLDGKNYLTAAATDSVQLSDAYEATRIYLKFALWNGEALGPYEYEMDFRAFADSSMKKALESLRLLTCTAVLACRWNWQLASNLSVVDAIEYAFDEKFTAPIRIDIPRAKPSDYVDVGWQQSNKLLTEPVPLSLGASNVYVRLRYRDSSVGNIQTVALPRTSKLRGIDITIVGLTTHMDDRGWRITLDRKGQSGRIGWSTGGTALHVISGKDFRISKKDRPQDDQIFLHAIDASGGSDFKVARKIDFTAAAVRYLEERFKDNKPNPIACNVFGCAVSNVVCGTALSTVRFYQTDHVVAEIGGGDLCAEDTGHQFSHCLPTPTVLPTLVPSDSLRVRFEFDNIQYFESKVEVAPLEIRDNVKLQTLSSNGWTVLSPLVAPDGDTRHPIALARTHDGQRLEFFLLIGHRGQITSRSCSAESATISYDLDGRGFAVNQTVRTSRTFSPAVPLRSYGDSITFRSESSIGAVHGPLRYALDVATIIQNSAQASHQTPFACAPASRQARIRVCAPQVKSGILPWLRVREIQYGSDRGLSESRMIEISAEDLIEVGQTSLLSRLQLDVPVDWPDLFYRFVIDDGSQTEMKRISFR